MEITNTPTTSDTKEQDHLHSTEVETTTTPAVELDELDDELLEEVAGGTAIYSPACVPIPD